MTTTFTKALLGSLTLNITSGKVRLAQNQDLLWAQQTSYILKFNIQIITLEENYSQAVNSDIMLGNLLSRQLYPFPRICKLWDT